MANRFLTTNPSSKGMFVNLTAVNLLTYLLKVA